MKTYAYAVNKSTKEKGIISADYAVDLREFNHNEFARFDFYCEHQNKLFKVHPRHNETGTSFFAFDPDFEYLNKLSSNGETLTHKAIKDALSQLSSLHLIDITNDSNYYLDVKKEKTEVEKTFQFDQEYTTDLYFELNQNQRKVESREYFYKWYGQLIVEIYVTHKVGIRKRNLFYKNDIPIFEIKISRNLRNKIGLDNKNAIITETEYKKEVCILKRMFEKEIKGKFISNPSSKEYEEMKKYKNEIEKFKMMKEQIEEKYKTAKDKMECIQSNLDYYDRIENDNNRLTLEIEKIEENNYKLIKQNNLLLNELEDVKAHPLRYWLKKKLKSDKDMPTQL